MATRKAGACAKKCANNESDFGSGADGDGDGDNAGNECFPFPFPFAVQSLLLAESLELVRRFLHRQRDPRR